MQAAGTKDITLDTPLMQYLATGELPATTGDTKRVKIVGRLAYLDERGRLWLRSGKHGAERLVPPIYQRVQLLD